MVAGSVDSEKVRELEKELNGIRSAFKDYIHNTRGIESGIGHELGNMHNKLASTANANDDLAIRLQTMAPLICNLEKSLGESKKKLQEESRLRREMEERCKVAESKHQAIRQEFDSLREENGALREELDGNRSQWEEFHSRIGSHREMRQSRLSDRSVITDDARRSDNDTVSVANLTKSSIPLDDSYLEVLEELETVTEQLISTQQKLWITEDKLGNAQSQIEELQDQVDHHQRTEEKLLAAETRLRELEAHHGRLRLAEARMNQLENQLTTDEALQARVLELEKELVAANNHIQYTNEVSGTRIEECKSHALAVNKELQMKLEEVAAQNEMLVKQVTHLQQRIADEGGRSEATTMMEPPETQGDHELLEMRQTIDKLSQENIALKTKISRLKEKTASSPNEEIFELKDQIETLQFELTATKDKHRLTLLENDAAWRRKLEKARGDTKSEIQAIQMTSKGKDKIVEGLQEQITTLCRERDLLEARALELESFKAMLERENKDNEHHIQNMEDQIVNTQQEKAKLELKMRSLKNNGQGSAVMIEEMKVEHDMIVAEVKAMEALLDCQNDKIEDDSPSENDLIERVTALRKSLERSQEEELKQIEELRDELDSVTQELAVSKAAQKKLRRALNIRGADQRDEVENIRMQLRLRDDDECQQRNPYARDPEPNDVPVGGFPISMSNKSHTNVHSASHYRSDPPTRDSPLKGNDFDLHRLIKRLGTVEEENCMLNTKTDFVGGDGNKIRANDMNGGYLPSSRGVDLRKEAIRQLESYLENEKSFEAIDGVHSDILLKLTAERQYLQEQLAEAKAANNQNEEELNASRDEISRLRHAISCLKEAISKMRSECNEILKEAEERENQNRSEIAGFASQLNELFKANKELEGSNASKAEQIQSLTCEISSVKDSLHAANEKYQGVVKELQSARQMVDDVRKAAEKNGRELATAEVRIAMREEREKERKDIQKQLDEAHRENSRLTRLMETKSEETLKLIQTLEKKLKDTVEKSERWQKASEKANQEINDLLEEKTNLKMELEALANELIVTREELDFANASLSRRRADLEKLKLSKSFGSLSAGKEEYKACKELHDEIQQVISHLKAGRDSTYSRKTEGLQLKAQLMDIDMSIGKIFRENIMLEEELDYFKNIVDETREAAERKGRREATREAWLEIREQHENEIRDFKDQFSSLVEENQLLESQLRKYEAAGTDSNDSTSAIELGNAELRKQVELSHLEAKSLSQECLKLRLAMESMKDEHEQVVDELKLRLRRESEGVVMRLQKEVKELQSEISEMQNIVDESMSKENEYRREIKRLLNVIGNSQNTLERVNEERHQMTEAMDVAKSSSTQIIEKLRSKLLSSSQEIADLSSKVTDLTLELEEKKRDLQETRNNKRAERQHVYNLHTDSSPLQEYINELEATLKFSREEVAQTKEELARFKNRAEHLEKEVKEHLALLQTTQAELAKERLDSDQTIKVLEAINNRLNSVDGMTPGHELGKTTSTTQMAERLEWRVEKLISITTDSIFDKRDKLKLQLYAETSEMKLNQAKQEASRLEDEVMRLIKELTLAKNKSSALNSKREVLAYDVRPRPESGATRTKYRTIHYLPSMKQANDRKPIRRADPEPRCTMDSDIISEVVSMKSMESTDYLSSSDLKKSNSNSSRRADNVDIRSEEDCVVIDVDRYQIESRSDPPCQGDLRMDNTTYHV